MTQAGGVTHLAQRFCFNLPNAFARHSKLFSDFLQGSWGSIAQAETQFQYLAFPFRKTAKNISELILEKAETRNFGRVFDRFVFNEIPKTGFIAVPDR